MKIREYLPVDFEELYRIDHAAFSEDIAYSRLELEYYLRSRKCRTLVAEEEDQIVGFVVGCSEPRSLGHIITIDVIPHRQRKQIGSRLLAEIEQWLWRKGAQAIYLENQAETHARLALGAARGLLLDLLVSGERDKVARAADLLNRLLLMSAEAGGAG